MSDLNNVNTELTDALAAGLETSGMSRRERRELAQRMAAEKAAAEQAARAEAEALEADAKQAGEAAAQQAGEVAQAVEAEIAEKALEADAIQDVSSGIVNIEPAQDAYDAIMDEPTREYKTVSKATLDDLMQDMEKFAVFAENVSGSVSHSIQKVKDALGIKSTEQLAKQCPSCGASVSGVRGEVAKCPYCGSFVKFM